MPGESFRFGPFLVDRHGYRVTRDGEIVPLTPKLLDLLLHLVDHAGHLVTKEALLDALWPGANVTDNALAQAVSELRDALGDEPKSPSFIKTVARRGYRFIARVEKVDVQPSAGASPASSRAARDTASLDAYRAMTAGSVRLESLDVGELPPAIADFERAVAIDPRYTLAFAGLASAELALYETTRSDNMPRADLLGQAIAHARHAVELDESLSEAHATLALVLVSAGDMRAAAVAARRAVSIEPSNWRHLFRLGHATWGEERLRAGASMLAIYPDFAFTYFQMAMVHVARGHLREAETVLRQGAAVQDRQIGRGGRFPALGLHWLLGLVRLALEDAEEALAEFDREASLAEPHRLYGREYAMCAQQGRGAALLAAGRFEEARDAFRRALDLYPDHAQSLIGLALASSGAAVNDAALAGAERVLGVLVSARPVEGDLVRASVLTARGSLSEAVATLDTLLVTAPPGFAGWSLPVEPLLAQLRSQEGFKGVLTRLSARAV
jgi:DNA-binding winged helix-turn-helix (wHTH) protein/Flp pilus assembly protein TadD